jgi:hypothetical protein
VEAPTVVDEAKADERLAAGLRLVERWLRLRETPAAPSGTAGPPAGDTASASGA